MSFTELKKAVEMLGKDYIQHLMEELIAADKKASGNLINSLASSKFVVLEVMGNILIRLDTPEYLKYVDKGRRPGKFPPPQKIRKWIDDRKIKPRGKDGRFITKDSAAFLIGRKIATQGIKPTNVIKKTADYILNNKKQLLGKAAKKDVMNALTKILNSI